jgi:glutathione synthase/RimK-type ligase-like ATP-grasp enzyme
VILVCGIPSEPPLALVCERLEGMGVPYVMFNQRQFSSAEIEFELSGGRVKGEMRLGGRSYRLEDFCSIYTRLMDYRFLPELERETPDSSRWRNCQALHDTIIRWCEIFPGRVVNRMAPMGSNSSKPYQAQLIRAQGFAVPETLITNDPDLVRKFRHQHNKVVYKSISSIRSIVQLLEDKDVARLEHILWCPTQFQAFVEGTNVRVHTVDNAVFATGITAETTDYRYASLQGGDEAVLYALDLPKELAEQCINLARVLELPFAGIDLKITPDSQVYCFEVNPSPGFSYYELNTGQAISDAVARYLAEAE